MNWHDKAPMNGRALTAKDVEFNFHRFLGLGSGFTEVPEGVAAVSSADNLGITSVTAQGNSVVFKLAELNLDAGQDAPDAERPVHLSTGGDSGGDRSRYRRLAEPGRHRTL